MNLKIKDNLKQLANSFSICFSLLIVFTLIVFAWITLSDETSMGLDGQMESYNMDCKLYVFYDSDRLGAIGTEITLIDNLYDENDNYDQAYKLTSSSDPMFLFDTENVGAAPGNRFSFAISVNNLEKKEVNLYFDITKVLNLYNAEELPNLYKYNDIRYAFKYTVTRITYLNGNTEIDIEDVLDANILANIKKAVDAPFASEANDLEPAEDNNYMLAYGVPIFSSEANNANVILYFDVYFDPNVSGYYPDGTPTGNSNPFWFQKITINRIKINFYSNS